MPSNILIIDDSKVHVKLLKMVLESENHRIFVSYDGKDLFKILADERIDVILLDVVLPDLDGFELLGKIMENPDTRDIPVIMVTGLLAAFYLKKAFDMGAMDYIRKPAEPIEIIARVNSALKMKIRQDVLKEYFIRDNLTKLHTKAYGEKVLMKCLDNNNFEKGISFAMIDCDFFKRINDNYGHISGDVVLSAVGSIILKSIKDNDVAIRYGGEEFSVILTNTPLHDGLKVCERIRNNIQRRTFRFEETEVTVTVSIGITHIKKNERINYLEFIGEADKALYKAKSNGRNRVESFGK